jgi:thiol-disulfide isomerase/thioredoxin
MIIGNDQVRVEGDVKDFPWDLSITGSKTEDENQKLKALTKALDNRRDELVEQYFKAAEDQKSVLAKSMNSIDAELRTIKIAFIKENPNTYVAAIALGELRNKLSKEEVSILYDLIDGEIKASKFGQVVQKFLEINVAKVGEAFTDFEAIDQKGNTVKLFDVKGKYILLDFTASYCVPCRQSAEELIEINKAYKDALTIVSVSADVSKEVWLQSLKRDKVNWLSLWDGKGSTGGAVLKYNASMLPTYVLIDEHGKIADKWKGYSTGSLKARLRKYNLAGE